MANLVVRPGNHTELNFRNKALSENSELSYSVGVRQYLEYLEKNGQVEGTDALINFLEGIKDSYQPATYNLKAQSIKEYLLKKYENDDLQRLAISELFKKAEIKRITVTNAVTEDAYLTKSQIDHITHGLLADKFVGSHRVALIIQTAFWSGLRVTELCNIKLADIKLNGNAMITGSGKGNKKFKTYIPLGLFHKIREVFNGQEHLFETMSGRKYTRQLMSKEINKKLKRFNLNCRCHILRHSKAMYLKDERGLSADQIAKALNHANVKTTLEHYFHGTPGAEEQGIGSWEF